jgi:hypothetical protein
VAAFYEKTHTMKKIIVLILLLPAVLHGQAIVKGSGIVYTNGAPTHTVNLNTDAEVAIDTTTSLWYERSRDGLGWVAAGFRVQKFDSSSPPSAAPLDKQSEVVLNNVDSLYRWRGGAWRHLNKALADGDKGDITVSGDTWTLDNNAVTTAKINDGAVTMSKINQASATSGQVIKWNGSAWAPAADATGGGGGAFTDLTDVPSSYSGQGGKIVAVNPGATALEFITVSGTGDALTSNPLSQFAATTSSQLAGVISDETGSGALVFGTSPTLTTPTIGVATATSVNKVAITPPATSATLTIANGATLTASANATVSGTNTGDQTITLTGDVTGTGTGSFAATIANGAVTMAKINQASATSGQVIKWNGSAWAPADDASGGVAEFIDLGDVPSSYAGQGGKYVAVNSGATALEFVNAPSGGGPSVIIKSADEIVNNSTTFQADDHLVFTCPANKKCVAEYHLFFTNANTAEIKFFVTAPGATTVYGGGTGAVFDFSYTYNQASTATGIRTHETNGSSQEAGFMRISAYVNSGASSRTVTLEWAQVTATAKNTTLQAGSWVSYSDHD